jgi:hypothetical protein
MKLLFIDIIYWIFSPLRFLSYRFLKKSFLNLLPKHVRDILATLFLMSRFFTERRVSFLLSRLKGNVLLI